MSIILNKEELATNELRRDALEILEAGLGAIDTEKILRKKLSVKNGNLCINGDLNSEQIIIPLPSPSQGEGQSDASRMGWGRVFFIGIGKCALDGAKVIEDILGGYLTGGIALDVRDPSESRLNKIAYRQCTHPLPSEQNISATKEILKMVENLTENDLVICLISGGGSALFDLPDEAGTAKLGLPGEKPLETIIRVTKELTAKGADIYELNAVRKSLSQVKGGKFAEICHPAPMVSLIFSDVLGNDLSVIASGPTVLDEPSEEVKNILICSNRDALLAMKIKAEELGFKTEIETEKLSGNATEIGKELALREPKSGSCFLFGGETTVKIRSRAKPAFAEATAGEGGRNQEMTLSALPHMPSDSVLICAASDGWDNTDHAGAIADTELFQKAKELGVSPQKYLEKSDSYNFFKKVSGAIYTGKLGSNVSDLYIMLYK